MIVCTTPRLARSGRRLRDAVLVLFALFVAHDAVFVAQFGLGSRLATAMTQGGHDGYWTPVSLIIAGSVGVVFAVALAVLARLERRASGIARAAAPGPPYVEELSSTWLRLFPTVALLFGVQENLEHLLVDGHLVGADPLVGAGSSLVLPVLAATTFLLAAVGSLVRWRIRVLEARLAGPSGRPGDRPSTSRLPSGWRSIAAGLAHRWTLSRPDIGRAPPVIPTRDAVATA